MGSAILNRLGSVLYWVFFTTALVVFCTIQATVWLLTTPFDPQRRITHLMNAWQGTLYLAVVPSWKIHIVGREKIDPRVTYVYAANHASTSDVVLVLKLRTQFKFVAKANLFRVPLLGWTMFFANYIPLERGHRESIAKMMGIARDWLKGGMSVLMFPEGTRSEDGRLRPFKHGAFTLARECNVKVLPIALHESHLLARKHSNAVAAGADIHITVEVLDPIDPADFADVESLSLATRERIRVALGQDEATEASPAQPNPVGSPALAS
jgi:1-acyl-sn-glycerol-3-phosphate acyltransferase